MTDNRCFFLVDARHKLVNGKRVGELTAVIADFDADAPALTLSFPDGTRARRCGDVLRHPHTSRNRPAVKPRNTVRLSQVTSAPGRDRVLQVIERPAEMVGTVLTGYGWQTYYVTPDGDLFVHVGDTATANNAPPQLLGRYESVDVARAIARHRLRRDVQMASEDMRVAFTDIATLIAAECLTPDWCRGDVVEAPVAAATARRSLPSLIRG